jgi:hypothetical protein
MHYINILDFQRFVMHISKALVCKVFANITEFNSYVIKTPNKRCFVEHHIFWSLGSNFLLSPWGIKNTMFNIMLDNKISKATWVYPYPSSILCFLSFIANLGQYMFWYIQLNVTKPHGFGSIMNICEFLCCSGFLFTKLCHDPNFGACDQGWGKTNRQWARNKLR